MSISTVACKKCGATYEKRTVIAIFRDQDSFRCVVCDDLIEEWSTSRFPTFKLLTRPDKGPKDG